MKRLSGFTLIELLIVVAIIAILAAIAVPNFLDAQIRAKASASKADMRSLAVAVESYTAQWNRPPLGAGMIGALGDDGSGSTHYVYYYDNSKFDRINTVNYLKPLTTPVAYISKVPADRFVLPVGYNRYRADYGKQPIRNPDAFPYYFDSTAPRLPMIHPGVAYYPTDTLDALFDLYKRGYRWVLVGCGPDRWRNDPCYMYWNGSAPGSAAIIYDPSNGTKSTGSIIRTSKGPIPCEPLTKWSASTSYPIASWLNSSAPTAPSTWN